MYLDVVREQIFAGTFDELMEESLKQKREIEERDKRIEERDRRIKEKNRSIEEKDKSIEEGNRTRRNSLIKLFCKFYPNEDSSFLNHISINQYDKVFDAILNNETLQQIKGICRQR